ncbi:MAG: hypothetical protein IK062_01600 [Selenomonadaceae bacterium]|nr:hypothetical protein [Selenomonadaceae bacterium]
MGKAKIIAKAYGVSAQKVFRLVAQKKRTGSLELELHKPKISEEDL